MTIWLLPTKSPVRYRGKYPTRARHLSNSGRGGKHIELNNGSRLWSIDERNAADWLQDNLNADYARCFARAVPMTAEQYATLGEAAEIERAASTARLSMEERREAQARSEALRRSIKDSPMAVAKRRAVERAAEFPAPHVAPAYPEGRAFQVWIRTPTFSGSFAFATLQDAREDILHRLLRADGVAVGRAPSGPNVIDPFGTFITGPDGFTETLADSPWRYSAPDFGQVWTTIHSALEMRATMDNAAPATAEPVSLAKPDLPPRPPVVADDFAPAVATVRRDNVEYHAGRDAWRSNLTKDSCPYLADGVSAARWNLGWQEACDSAAPMAPAETISDYRRQRDEQGARAVRAEALAASRLEEATAARIKLAAIASAMQRHADCKDSDYATLRAIRAQFPDMIRTA